MAFERVSDMLPYDFVPNSKTNGVFDKNDEISIINRYLNFKEKQDNGEQVFVHTDRNLYRAGDTIHFKIYVLLFGI